jgi:hypothetical protein
LLTNADGCPVAVEVWEGNTADPKTIPDQVMKLRQNFGLQRLVLVGDRGMITSARIREDSGALTTVGVKIVLDRQAGAKFQRAVSVKFPEDSGIRWITALRATSIQKLAADGALQLSLFDTVDLAEMAHPEPSGERLVVCLNPVLSEERGRKREDLLQATEMELEKIATATQQKKRPLRGKHTIGLRVGRVLGRFKMGKHNQIHIDEDGFRCERKMDSVEREKKLDGIYVIRTNVAAGSMPASAAVRNYKQLSGVERTFRSLKTVDLHVRPIHHRLAYRVACARVTVHAGLLCGVAHGPKAGAAVIRRSR